MLRGRSEVGIALSCLSLDGGATKVPPSRVSFRNYLANPGGLVLVSCSI